MEKQVLLSRNNQGFFLIIINITLLYTIYVNVNIYIYIYIYITFIRQAIPRSYMHNSTGDGGDSQAVAVTSHPVADPVADPVVDIIANPVAASSKFISYLFNTRVYCDK